MRILVPFLAYGGKFPSTGGGDEVAWRLIKALVDIGFNVDVVTNKEGAKFLSYRLRTYTPMGKSLRSHKALRIYYIKDLAIDNLPPCSATMALEYIWRTSKLLVGSLPTINYDAVVVPTPFLPDLSLMSILKSKNTSITTIALVYHLVNLVGRGLNARNIASYASQLWSFKLLRKNADFIITYPHNQRWIKSLFPEQKILTAVLGGLPEEWFQDVNNRLLEYLEKPEYFLVTYIGGLRPYKRLDYLIDAYKRLQLKTPRNTLGLIIAGSADSIYLRKLVSKAHKLIPIPHWTIKIIGGYITEKLKVEILRRSRVFVNPSLEEGFSIAIAEALLYANKVVVMKEIRDVVKTYYKTALENNVLFVANDIDDLCEKILYALSDTITKDVYEEILEELKRYCWSNFSATLWDIFTRILGI